jgi:hypothetical protein
LLIKERANHAKLRKMVSQSTGWQIFPTKSWWRIPTGGWNIRHIRRVVAKDVSEEFGRMIGKLFGAWLGNKVAGENEGAKGAILGYGAAALAKRSVPLLAGVALGGWAFKKWRGKRRSHAAYPSDAAPRAPASETRSPS